jgi:actin-related protein 5
LDIEQLLLKYDTSMSISSTSSAMTAANGDSVSSTVLKKSSPEAEYQLHLLVERIRIPEIVFQPSLIGTDQMGLAEAIHHTLNQLSASEQAALMKVSDMQ